VFIYDNMYIFMYDNTHTYIYIYTQLHSHSKFTKSIHCTYDTLHFAYFKNLQKILSVFSMLLEFFENTILSDFIFMPERIAKG
jgi:hypothetical protein